MPGWGPPVPAGRGHPPRPPTHGGSRTAGGRGGRGGPSPGPRPGHRGDHLQHRGGSPHRRGPGPLPPRRGGGGAAHRGAVHQRGLQRPLPGGVAGPPTADRQPLPGRRRPCRGGGHPRHGHHGGDRLVPGAHPLLLPAGGDHRGHAPGLGSWSRRAGEPPGGHPVGGPGGGPGVGSRGPHERRDPLRPGGREGAHHPGPRLPVPGDGAPGRGGSGRGGAAPGPLAPELRSPRPST
jgi:translation initiation factor IF-2